MFVETLLSLCLLIYIVNWWKKGYWRRRNVFALEGEFLFGSTRGVLLKRLDISVFLDDIYKNHKEKKLVGAYNFLEPILVVTDVEYIRQILTTDYSSFPISVVAEGKRSDPLMSFNPFVSYGKIWKERRGIQTSLLTPSKIKEYCPLIQVNCQAMVKYLAGLNGTPVKVADISKYYMIDNVVSTAFGYVPTSFVDPDSGFRKYAGKSVLDSRIGFSVLVDTFASFLSNTLKTRIISKEAEEFFKEMSKKIIDFRKQSKVVRNDLIDHLLKIEQKRISEGKTGFDPEEAAGYMMTIYVESVETSSTVLNFFLLELANRPEVQDKIREEMWRVSKDPMCFDVEKVNSLVYLNMVFNEIMRIHPLVFFFSRRCVQNTKIGTVEIEKGTKVFIPYCSLIKDSTYYPDPETFDPERFSPSKITSNVKGSFFPFGEGPKQCPGMKYAMFQIKIGLLFILLKFKLLPVKMTDGKIVENATEASILQKPDDEETLIFQSI